MAVTTYPFLKGIGHILDGTIDLDTDAIKAAVLEDTYTPAQATDEFWDEISAHEAAADDYVAGGAALTVSVVLDAVGMEVEIDAVDLEDEWIPAGPTGRYVVFYQDTGVAATSALISWQNLGANTALSGVTFNAEGLLKLTLATPA